MRSNVSLSETMFIIGSGPSLNEIDIKLLKGLNTISLNRQHIAYRDWGFWPKYYVCIDAKLVIKTYMSEIIPLMRDPKCEIENFFIIADVLPDMHILGPRGLTDIISAPEKLIQIPSSPYAHWKQEVIDKFTACCANETLAKARYQRALYGCGSGAGISGQEAQKERKEVVRLKSGLLPPAKWEWTRTMHEALKAASPLSRGANLLFRDLSGAFSTSLSHALGYKRAVLLGMDARYVARESSIEAQKDLNHFHSSYFDVKEFEYGVDFGESKGHFFPWERMTDSESPEQLQIHKDKDFEIISSSPGSALNNLFEYINLEKLLKTYEVNNEY